LFLFPLDEQEVIRKPIIKAHTKKRFN